MSETERLIYEESVRTVDGQRELLEGVRARAGTLLATAFVATAFFGAQGLDRHRPGRLEWSAIALFLAVVIATLIVLTPWRLQFAHQRAHVYRTLAYWNGVHYDRNGRKLEALVSVFGVACASLVGEIIAWLVALGGT